MTLDEEIDFYYRRRDAELKKKEQEDEEARKVHLKRRRSELLDGSLTPNCTCRECIRAILSLMEPAVYCEKRQH